MEVNEGVRTIEFCFYGIGDFLTARTLTSSSVSYLRGHFGFVYLNKGLNVDEDLSF